MPNDNTPQITWLTQSGSTLPSVRFRVLPFAELARRRFDSPGVSKIPKTILQRLSFYAKLPKTDICILQKRLLSHWETALIRRRCRLLVYDFDDAVWTNQEESLPLESGCRRKRFIRMCHGADIVIAGNAYLASQVPGGAKTIIMPTPIDTGRYIPPPCRNDTQNPLIGWMGTASYLPEVMAVLQSLGHLGLPMQVVSNREPEQGAALNYTFHRWSGEDELARLQSFDIGLMPLGDSVYTRGKGGFKILQYMACGVVPVASAVGINKEIISHGKNGFLVEPGQSWLPFVERLRDPALRSGMAAAARQSAIERFDLKKVADDLFEALQKSYREKQRTLQRKGAP